MSGKIRTFLKEYPHAWAILYFAVYIPWFIWLESRASLPYHVIHFPLDDYCTDLVIFSLIIFHLQCQT